MACGYPDMGRRVVLIGFVRGRDTDGGFFFSSRRRHTRSDRDWSSDVCSSDLLPSQSRCHGEGRGICAKAENRRDRKSVVLGKSVDLGGRRIIKKKKKIKVLIQTFVIIN